MAIIKTLKGMPAPRFGKHCYFSEGAVIAGDVEMGDDCTVWFNAVVRGDVHFIKIGNRTNIQDNSCLHTLNGKAPCILGDDVTIGHSVTLHGCEIKDGALVGMGATVLDHAVVGRGAIVAAGALVLGNTVIGDGEYDYRSKTEAEHFLYVRNKDLENEKVKELMSLIDFGEEAGYAHPYIVEFDKAENFSVYCGIKEEDIDKASALIAEIKADREKNNDKVDFSGFGFYMW